MATIEKMGEYGMLKKMESRRVQLSSIGIAKAIAACGVVLAFAGCGSKSSTEDTPAAASVAFEEVNSVLTNRCGGTTCHSSGAAQNAYVDNETLLKSNKSTVISRVVTVKDMPPTNASSTQLAITDDERTKIKTFLSQ